MRTTIRAVHGILLLIGLCLLASGIAAGRDTATLPPSAEAELISRGLLRDEYAVSTMLGQYGVRTETVTVAKTWYPAAQFRCAVGAVLTLACLTVLLLTEHKLRRLEHLRACGIRQPGVVTWVHRKFDSQSGDAALRVAEVACLHPVTGKKITMKSMSFLFLSVKRGDPADVLFDPVNDRIRMVDLTDL